MGSFIDEDIPDEVLSQIPLSPVETCTANYSTLHGQPFTRNLFDVAALDDASDDDPEDFVDKTPSPNDSPTDSNQLDFVYAPLALTSNEYVPSQALPMNTDSPELSEKEQIVDSQQHPQIENDCLNKSQSDDDCLSKPGSDNEPPFQCPDASDNEPPLQCPDASDITKKFIGRRKVKNTEHNNRNAMNRF